MQEEQDKKIFYGLSFVNAYLYQVSFVDSILIRCNFDTKDMNAIEINKDRIDEDKPYDYEFYSDNRRPLYENDINESDFDGFNEKVFCKLVPGTVSKIKEVDFFLAELELCRFRNAYVMVADFRYTQITNCSMSEVKFYFSDFYYCCFRNATSFINSLFIRCSFPYSVFENDCIRLDNIPKGILQDDYETYHHIIHYINWIRYNPCNKFSSLNHGEEKGDQDKSELYLRNESAEFYKQMSGMYAGKGYYRDSKESYKKSKQKELSYNWLSFKNYLKNISKETKIASIFLLKTLCNVGTWALGYGYKWQAPVIWLFVIFVIFSLVYWLISPLNIWDAISYSFSGSASISPVCEQISLLVCSVKHFQTLLETLLIGYLGFIFANNLRNGS